MVTTFDGGDLTSDSGLLLLSSVDRHLRLSESLASVVVDNRQPAKVVHQLVELMRTRLGAIAAGYPDCNDLNTLRRDPALRLFSGCKLKEHDLAGQATLSRWENSVSIADLKQLGMVLMASAIAQLPPGTRQVVVDVDSTDDPCHGQQQLEGFNAYYGHHCFHPLLVHVCGVDSRGKEGRMWPVAAVLRGGNTHGSRFFRPAVSRVIDAIRVRFPGIQIIVRADSGFGSDKLMRLMERKKVDYVLGVPKNAALTRWADAILAKAWTMYSRWPKVFCPQSRLESGKKGPVPDCIAYGGFIHNSDSWTTCRRVVVKAAITHAPFTQKPELNPRYVVTNLMNPQRNLQGKRWKPEEVYRFYCRRGDQENRIKEWKLDMQSGRTSCHRFTANQFRLILHTAAMLLLNVLQEQIPVTSKFRNPQINTLRLQLLKVAARVTVSCRRICVQLPTAFPHADLWLALNQNLHPARAG